MTEELGFLLEIESKPDDDTPRLVYADWLDERGDARAAYLRAEVALAGGAPQGADPDEPRRRLMDARAGADPAWLARLEQPGVLRAVPVPYEAGWVGTDLGKYRPEGGTYGGWPYRTLPPLPVEKFTGDFGWLGGAGALERAPAGLTSLMKKAQRRHVALPEAFLTFFRAPALRGRMRSCTASFFRLPTRLIPAPKAPGDYVLNFYSDSQGCYHWYLFLTPSGAHCVVGSNFSPKSDEPETAERSPWHFCAPSFGAFLYREWIENEVWYALNEDDAPLTEEQRAYVGHYKKGKKRT